MKRSTYIWSLLVGCVAFATSCDLTENVQVKADKSMIFGSKSGLELYSNSFYKALPTLKNGFMQDKMCDVGAVSNTDTFIKQGAYNTETATSWSWGALKNVNYFIDGCNDPKYCTVEAETRDNYLGIARWFRAWFYYDKLTTYGEVPWFPNDIQSYQNDVMYKDRDSRDVIPQPDRRPRFRLRAHPGHLVDRQRDAHALGRRRAQVARLPLRSGLPPLPQPHGA